MGVSLKMALNETSILALHRIKNSKRLNTQQYQVYQYIIEHPFCSRREIEEGLELRTSTATGRIGELKDMDFIFVDGTKKCDYTGNKVVVYVARTKIDELISAGKVVKKPKVHKTLSKYNLELESHEKNFLKDQLQSLDLENDIWGSQPSNIYDGHKPCEIAESIRRKCGGTN